MAASKKHNYVRSWQISRNTVTISGKFQPNGSSAIAASSFHGLGWTAVRTSAGLFTITFDENYSRLMSAHAHLQLGTGDDKFAQVGTWTQSARTVTIRVWDISGAAETDVANGTQNWIHFRFEFATGQVKPLHS